MVPTDSVYSALENIYISPLELCNLHCRYCYTKKTKNILSNRQILSFIRRYHQQLLIHNRQLKSIIFCGGEVFTLRNFPRLVNKLLTQKIFITIITNGTIDRLKEIKDPQNCQLIVSLDGPRDIHDQNRGIGNFDKSVEFINHAQKLGFPVAIFYLVSKLSYPYIDSFSNSLYGRVLNPPLSITFLPDRLGSLTSDQVKNIRQNYRCYPPKDFGCSILSLQSDGKFYGCCESSKSIGTLHDPLNSIIQKYLKISHSSCSDPDFHCHL